MAYEQKDNTGALFANKDRKSDTHAHAKGNCLIDGVEYWVDAWTNTDRNGSKYQSLKFKRKEGGGQRQEQSSYDPDPDGEIPF